MAKTKLTAGQYMVLVAVIAMYFFAPTQGIISSVLHQINETYPEVGPAELTYLTSINNLFAVFSALLFSMLAGRKLSHRTIGIIALLFFVVGGGLPAFLPDTTPFWVLLVTRAVMGLGRGCFIPIIQAVLCDFFHDEKQRSAMFGFASIFFNIGATTGTTIAGWLGLINWHLCFAFYLFAVIPLALYTVFFREPQNAEEFSREKLHIPAIAWAFFLLYTAALIVSQMLWNYASTVMSILGINSLEVGTILSMFTIAAILLAALFTFVFRVFKTQTCAFGICIEGLGFVVLFLGTVIPDMALPLFYIGAFLIGFGCNAVTLGVPMIMSVTVPAAAVTAALGLSEVFHNLGAFLSSPFSQVAFFFAGPDAGLNVIFIITAVFAFVMTAVSAFVGVKAKAAADRRRKDDEDASKALESSANGTSFENKNDMFPTP
mgnify:FL=1